MITMRLSDTRTHAEEFSADSQSTFTLALFEALQRYRAHFAGRAIPRPHRHVFTTAIERKGRWVDAGYGSGTYIMLSVDMMQNTPFLVEIWSRCQKAAAKAAEFAVGFGALCEAVQTDLNQKPPQ